VADRLHRLPARTVPLISFRQHVVTLVAVFLALAVGVVLGGGPLSEVGRDVLTTTATQPRADHAGDGGEFGDAFAVATANTLYDEGLAGRSIALVTLPGADERVVEGLVGQVEHAGGTVEGRYAAQEALVDPGEKSLVDTLGSQLMTQLDSGAADEDAPTYERLGQLLGTAIATSDKDGAGASTTVLSIRQSLAGAELVASSEQEPDRAPLVLVVLGDEADDDILGGLLTGLASRALGVVVAGDTQSGANGDVAALRTRPDADEVATVDGVELVVGQVTTVLALVRSLTDKGGSFGASGSDGAVPLR
jgi:Copper transport outer membrane protein, MctB